MQSPAVPSDAERVTVTWVLDGDSFEIDGPGGFDEVRLIGINAPEGGECLGGDARDLLIDRIARQEVFLSGNERDEFGRRLAYLWFEGRLLNMDLISQGLVVARSAFGHEYDAEFDDAEALAQDQGMGLWAPSACGTLGGADRSVALILDVNFDAEGRDDENPNGEWIDILNPGTEASALGGWTVRDESTRHRFAFPVGFHLGPGETVRIRSGCGTDSELELFWCDPFGTVWSNGGDTAFLLTDSGAIVDTMSWDSIYPE